MVELLDSVNLKELPVNEDMDAAKNLHALHISLLIQSGSEKYYITAAGAQNVYLNLWQGDEIVRSCILDINADLIQKLTEINRKVQDYSYDGSGFMEISKAGADIQNLNNADSLYLADIMEAALESGISEDGAENVKAEDFAVKMKLDGQVWYLNPETRIAGKETDGTISAVEMDDRYFLPVMRKMSGLSHFYPLRIQVKLLNDFHKKNPTRHFLRGRMVIKNGEAYFVTLPKQENGMTTAMRECSLFGEIPAGVEEVPEGTIIFAYDLEHFR